MESNCLNSLVSVVTPVYNCSRSVGATIASVASQTVQVLEHIVIDDGSTDDTVEVVESMLAEFPHVVLIKQANSGAGIARNAGISAAKGKYIAFLDGDDLWLPDKLHSQIEFMELNMVEFSYGAYDEIDDKSGECALTVDPPFSLTYSELLNGCPIGCLTVAYNQYTLGKKYMPAVRRGQDWGLWLSITRNGVVGYKYPGNLARYNRSRSSLSKNKIRKLVDVYEIYRKEEQLSVLQSVYRIIRHSFYVIGKRINVT